MHFSKALLCDTILIAQMFTILTILNMINSLHDAKDKSSSKNKDFFANEVKDSKI